jgi:ATP-dependent exoDNAse (exonuclease V) alpha subunit
VYHQTKELKTYNDDKITSLLDKDKSFFLMGRGGYGKTWTIKNTIIPHLEITNKKYKLSSTTNANAKEIDGVAIQTMLFKKDTSLEKLEEYFKDTDYLIIDEASQMTLDVMTTLNHLKLTIGLNIIASGDINQCTSVDAVVSWLHSYPFKHMVDHKFIKLEWKDVGRYSKEYDEFLDSIINCNYRYERLKLIKQYFKGQKVRDGNQNQKHLNLVYTHDKGKLMDAYKTIGKKAYNTIHSVQGESLDEIHNIYEIQKMPKDVLYTALSRTTKKEHIRIILKKKE